MDSRNSVSEQIMPNMCVCIRWDLWLLYCILVRPGRDMSMNYFSCLGSPCMCSTKNVRDTSCQTCVFASGGICGSRSAF
jgi:hypothetical protein